MTHFGGQKIIYEDQVFYWTYLYPISDDIVSMI